jgi:hypothetical protein
LLNVIRLNVVMLSAVIVNVMAPHRQPKVNGV